jgi:K+-transporting ATPase KdpF subunit
MSLMTWLGAALAVALFIYLGFALLYPERLS